MKQPQAPKQYRGVHLFVLCHGFQGSLGRIVQGPFGSFHLSRWEPPWLPGISFGSALSFPASSKKHGMRNDCFFLMKTQGEECGARCSGEHLLSGHIAELQAQCYNDSHISNRATDGFSNRSVGSTSKKRSTRSNGDCRNDREIARNSFDMRLMKNNIALLYPDAIFLCSQSNEDCHPTA